MRDSVVRGIDRVDPLKNFHHGLLDADFLFFNLKPEAMADDPRRDWLQADEFRRAVSQAVDRKVFSETVLPGSRRAGPRADHGLEPTIV